MKFRIKQSKRRLYVLAVTLPLLVVMGIALYLSLNLASKVEAVWYNDDWAYRIKVPITAHTGAETNKYFSVTIDSSDTTKFQGDCGDIRFTDMNGKLLQYYIASGCSSASTVIHVLVPVFPAGATDYYYYYGNPNAVNGFSATDFSAGSSITVGTLGSQEKGTGPLAFWHFDEGSDNTCSGGTNDVCDGGAGHVDAAAAGTVTWQTDDLCLSGKCLKFNGSTGTLNAGDASTLNFERTSAFTFQTWIRTKQNTSMTLMSKQGSSAPFAGWNVQTGANGYVYLQLVNTYSSNTLEVRTSDTGYADNKWHHIATTYDGSSSPSGVKIYVDGKSLALTTSVNTLSSSISNSSNVHIGSRNGAQQFFNGVMDEPKIYNYVRSASQVLSDANNHGGAEGVATSMGDQSLLSNGLVGYWRLDESATPALDNSGNVNSGTWTASPTSTSGKFGSAISLASASSQYITIADSANLSPTSQVSITAWINPTTNVTSRSIAVKDTAYRMTTNASSQIVCEVYSGGAWLTAATGSTTLTTGAWQHLACTYNGSVVTAYVNGATDGTSSVTGTINDSSAALEIGRNVSTNYFNGGIDEVRVYNKALGGLDIRSLYRWSPGPVGYWKFDEKSGASVYDVSGGGNTGTIVDGGTAGSWKQGKFGSSYYMSGKDGSSDTLNLASTTTVGTANTVSFWAKFTSFESSSNGTVIIGRGTGASEGYMFYIDNTSIYSREATGSAVSISNTLSLGVWYHLAVTRDGTTIKFYANGLQIGTTQTLGANNSFDYDSLTNFSAGAQNYPIDGYLDEVRVYNYARTPAQIIEDMNGSHPAGGSPIASQAIYWPFDEQTGAAIYNVGNTGSAYQGTANGPQWSGITVSGCKVNGCLYFDSSADYVSAATATSTFFDGLTGFGTSFWIKPSTLATNSMIVSKANNVTQRAFQIKTDDTTAGKLKVMVSSSASDVSNYCVTTNTVLTNGTWTHISVSYDGTQSTGDDNRVRVFVNGNLSPCPVTGTIPTALTTTTSNLKVGQGDDTTPNSVLGNIDEFKLYNAPISRDQAKIEANYGSGTSYSTGQDEATQITGTAEAPAVGYWKMEDTGGSTEYDRSGQGYDATINNAPTRTRGCAVGACYTFVAASSQDMTVAATISVKTVSFWVKPTATTASLIQLQAAGAVAISATTGTLSATGFTSPTIYVNGVVSSTIVANVWQHITVTTGTTVSGTQIKFGHVNATYFSGQLDEIKFYDYARTGAQVAYDYNRGRPVGWWQADECQGTTLNDNSGNTNHATITIGGSGVTPIGTCNTSSTAWGNGVTGKYNSSLSFDGTDDYALAADSVSLSPTTAVTISQWLYPTAAGGAGGDVTTIWKGDIGVGTDQSYGFIFDNNRAITFRIGSTSTTDSTTCNTVLTLNTWNHLIGIYNGTNMYIYLNGILCNSKSTAIAALKDTSESMAIGCSIDGTNTPVNYFTGRIDDTRVYNYAMTISQVRKLYNNDAGTWFGPLTGSP